MKYAGNAGVYVVCTFISEMQFFHSLESLRQLYQRSMHYLYLIDAFKYSRDILVGGLKFLFLLPQLDNFDLFYVAAFFHRPIMYARMEGWKNGKYCQCFTWNRKPKNCTSRWHKNWFHEFFLIVKSNLDLTDSWIFNLFFVKS